MSAQGVDARMINVLSFFWGGGGGGKLFCCYADASVPAMSVPVHPLVSRFRPSHWPAASVAAVVQDLVLLDTCIFIPMPLWLELTEPETE